MRRNARLLALLFPLIVAHARADAADRPATSCAYADVQAAITAAGNGDTILVPAGTCAWSTVLKPDKKYVTLQGAGIGQTVLTQGDKNVQLIQWTTIAGGLSRITGLTIEGATGGGVSYPTVEIRGASATMRIDHVRFVVHSASMAALHIYGYVRGVADHNQFDLTGVGFCCGYYVHHHEWDAPGTNFGDASWAAPDSWGTDQAWYWETNQITYDNTGHASGSRHAATSDGWQGSRVVNRFNTYLNVLLSGGHGTDTGQRWRGRRQTESYGETLVFDCAACGGGDSISPAIAGRGGSMFVFDNTITARNGATVPAGGAIQLAIDRFRRVATSYQPWTYCGETAITSLTAAGVMTTAVGHGIGVAIYSNAPTKVRITGATGADAALYNGVHDVVAIGSATQATLKLSGTPSGAASGTLVLTSPFDGNTLPGGYPCLDQAGYGQSDLLVGTNPSPVAWPHQVLTPSLYWHNTLNGVAQAPVGDASLVLNREYRDDSSIGQGPRAARPAACTTGDLYWVTDEGTWNHTVPAGTSGKLYRCAGTQWAAWYGSNNSTGEPLVYPHPLVTGETPPEPPVPTPSPTVTITLRFDGGGAGGTITSDPPGIDTSVAGAISAPFPAGTEVILRATPKSNNTVFAGWDGACAAAGVQPACTVGLAGDTIAGARFVK
jgi:hypothetical protein